MTISGASMVIGDRKRDSVQCTGSTIERHEKTSEQLAAELAAQDLPHAKISGAGQYLHPLIVAGDEKQLPPAVMPTTKKTGDNFLNTFPYFSRISILNHFKNWNILFYPFNKQLRIADSQFDLIQSLIYPDIAGFSYRPKSSAGDRSVCL